MRSVFLLLLTLLAACDRSPAPAAPPATAPTPAPVAHAQPARPLATAASVIAAPVSAAIVALGTEPFWSATIAGARLTYTTPETPAGRTATVARDVQGSATRFSGKLGDKPLSLVIAPGVCSDGMSDRSYPFTARLTVDGSERRGCARLPDSKENAR